MKHLITFLTIMLLFGACDSNSPSNADKLAELKDISYTFRVDRTADLSGVQFPSDELKEEDYSTITSEKIYAITFSADGQSVSIQPGSISGQKTNDSGKLIFNLTDGLFAGGRFVVWVENDSFEAELTVYGSGVPMLSSERGELENKE